MFDFRVEKQFRFGSKARVGLFLDLFNVMNSNTDVNINWRVGRGVREGDDGARAADRQVRREVRLVGAVPRTAARG